MNTHNKILQTVLLSFLGAVLRADQMISRQICFGSQQNLCAISWALLVSDLCQVVYLAEGLRASQRKDYHDESAAIVEVLYDALSVLVARSVPQSEVDLVWHIFILSEF